MKRAIGAFGSILISLTLFSSEGVCEVRCEHAVGFASGGDSLGGGHPTVAKYGFRVPDSKHRLLLASAAAPYNPEDPGRQRGRLVQFTYAGKPLTFLNCKMPERPKGWGGLPGLHWWYLIDPPVGTHEFVLKQHRCDNGYDSYFRAAVFSGVDPKDPFSKPQMQYCAAKGPNTFQVKSRAGGLVFSEFAKSRPSFWGKPVRPLYLLQEKTTAQLRYLCGGAGASRIVGSAAPGADKVDLAWFVGEKVPCFLKAITLNPAEEGASFKPSLPLKALSDSALVSEKPGLVARVYDHSANPPEASTLRVEYKRAAVGTKIPEYDASRPHTTKVIERIDFHPRFHNPKYRKLYPPRPFVTKGILGSGLKKDFVLEIRGLINTPATGTTLFKLLSNDQTRFYINGRLIIDNYGNNYNCMKTVAVELEKGRHEIRLENVEDSMGARKYRYGENWPGFGVQLAWGLPPGCEQPAKAEFHHIGPRAMPASAFSHLPRHLEAGGESKSSK